MNYIMYDDNISERATTILCLIIGILGTSSTVSIGISSFLGHEPEVTIGGSVVWVIVLILGVYLIIMMIFWLKINSNSLRIKE